MGTFVNNFKDGFTVVDNSIINGKKLKLEALGLYTFLVSKPTGWNFSYRGLSSQLLESEKTLRRIVKQLVEAKLLLRVLVKDKNNNFAGYDWILHPTEEQLEAHIDPALRSKELPNTELPKGKLPKGKLPNGELQNGKGLSNTKPSNTKESKKECSNKKFSTDFNTQEDDILNEVDNIEAKQDLDIFEAVEEANDDNKPKSKKDAEDVANYLLEHILSFKPNIKQPNLSVWVKDIEKAIRIDKRTKEELVACIDWIYNSKQGNFWIPNILSGKKLRDKFDTMEAQMIREQGNSTYNHNKQALEAFVNSDDDTSIWG